MGVHPPHNKMQGFQPHLYSHLIILMAHVTPRSYAWLCSPDHHRLCPYGTLWTDIDVGSGARLLDSSGPPPAGVCHMCSDLVFHV